MKPTLAPIRARRRSCHTRRTRRGSYRISPAASILFLLTLFSPETDGTPMDVLGKQTFELTLRVASGERSAGEKAAHAQVQIWRNWNLESAVDISTLKEKERSGASIPLAPESLGLDNVLNGRSFKAISAKGKLASEQIDLSHCSPHSSALVLPTSLCSGQVAAMIAKSLTESRVGKSQVSRFVALPHTEGCGSSSGDSETIFSRTLLGYLTHPIVRHALLLEHGCEKTHNAYFSEQMAKLGVDKGSFGWASVQLDGGIESVTKKVGEHFSKVFAGDTEKLERKSTNYGSLRIGLLAPYGAIPHVAEAFSRLTASVVALGGTVVIPDTQRALLSNSIFLKRLLPHQAEASLSYGQHAPSAGFHVMQAPTTHWIELLTGLGATGVDLMIAFVQGVGALQTHPMVPLLQLTDASNKFSGPDFDLILPSDTEPDSLLSQLAPLIEGSSKPKLFDRNWDFQITRGYLGISM